jgi:hypothetical protein
MSDHKEHAVSNHHDVHVWIVTQTSVGSTTYFANREYVVPADHATALLDDPRLAVLKKDHDAEVAAAEQTEQEPEDQTSETDDGEPAESSSEPASEGDESGETAPEHRSTLGRLIHGE